MTRGLRDQLLNLAYAAGVLLVMNLVIAPWHYHKSKKKSFLTASKWGGSQEEPPDMG